MIFHTTKKIKIKSNSAAKHSLTFAVFILMLKVCCLLFFYVAALSKKQLLTRI